MVNSKTVVYGTVHYMVEVGIRLGLTSGPIYSTTSPPPLIHLHDDCGVC
jgi:hypothetical protein